MFDLKIKTNEYLANNWISIEDILKKSFELSAFNPGYNLEKLLEEILSESIVEVNSNINHIMAFNNNGLIGGVFCIQKSNKSNKDFCDVGWIFTSYILSYRNRILLFDQLVKTAHIMILKAGFKKIITEIGTKEGVKLLSKRHGYNLINFGEQKGKWCKELIDLI